MHSNKHFHFPAASLFLLIVLLIAGVIVMFGPTGVGVITASAETTYMINDNGKVSYYTTSATDPADVLDEAGLELGIDDTYTITESNGYPGIYVQRVQTVTIDNGGQLLRTGSYGETVESLLNRLNVSWDEDDTISENLDAETYDGMMITISRKTYATESYSKTIPNKTVYRDDPTMPEGQEEVVTAGSDGEMLCTARVTYENGQEVDRKVLSNHVTKAPVNQVIAVGTAPAEQTKGELTIGDGVITTADGDVLTYTSRKTMVATGYSCESTGGYGITATGTRARVGAIAVDPNVIPYGTRMFIVTQDGSYIYGIATAEDTGHPDYISGNRIDLYYDTIAECVEFGVRNCDVYILG